MKYYLEDTDKVLRELESSEQGLSSGEAAARLQQNGKNVLIGTERPRCGRRSSRRSQTR